jgi:hypothetical protein
MGQARLRRVRVTPPFQGASAVVVCPIHRIHDVLVGRLTHQVGTEPCVTEPG